MLAITCRSIALNVAIPGPQYSTIRPSQPATPWRRNISKITSLALAQSGSLPVNFTPPDQGNPRKERLPRHCQRHFQPASADGQHANRVGRRRVTVRAEQRLARLTEIFLAARMAYPVSGPRVPQAESLTGAAQEKVVVGVLEALLDDVVVNVLDAHLGLHPVQALRLQLRHNSVPVASWVSVWSLRIPFSSPGFMSPCIRCDSISFCVTVMFIFIPPSSIK